MLKPWKNTSASQKDDGASRDREQLCNPVKPTWPRDFSIQNDSQCIDAIYVFEKAANVVESRNFRFLDHSIKLLCDMFCDARYACFHFRRKGKRDNGPPSSMQRAMPDDRDIPSVSFRGDLAFQRPPPHIGRPDRSDRCRRARQHPLECLGLADDQPFLLLSIRCQEQLTAYSDNAL
ncbi:MAG: hypothetical protein QNJ20_03270 [Paracoccaceae bacterium]|nr:hypothetical protein [Paracoccaceae bacterium]